MSLKNKLFLYILGALAVFSVGVTSGIFLNEKFGKPSSVVNLKKVKIKGSPGSTTSVEVVSPVMVTPDSVRRRDNRRERRKRERQKKIIDSSSLK